MSCYSSEVMTIINIYLFVSPFIILYLYQKSKKPIELDINAEDIVKKLEEEFGADYMTLMESYGSIEGYEDAMMADLDIMRNYLKKVLITLVSATNSLSHFSDNVSKLPEMNKDELMSFFLENIGYIVEDFKKCSMNLEKFILSEEEAHTRPHSVSDIKERRKEREKQK